MKNSIAFFISVGFQCYYMFLQNFIPVYWFVALPWGIINLVLIYRLFVSSSHKKKSSETPDNFKDN